MTAQPDLYEILGVGRDATSADIRAAFRGKAKTMHPDVNTDPGAEAAFKMLNEAAEILGDPIRRKRYDENGDMSQTPNVEDAAKAMALDFMSHAVNLARDTKNPFSNDLIGMARNHVKTKIRKVHRAMDSNAKERKFANELRRRIKSKGPENIFVSRIDSQMKALDDSDKMNNFILEVCAATDVLLEDYHFDREMPEPPTFYQSGNILLGNPMKPGGW